MAEHAPIEFFSPKALGQRWCKSRSHIYDLIAEGSLSTSKWGRSVMIHRTEVERYEREMGQCRTDTTSECTGANPAPPSTLAESGKAGLRLARSTAKLQSAG